MAPVLLHVGGLGTSNAFHFGHFGVGGSDAFGTQSAPGTPPLFQGRALFTDFGAQRGPKEVPKWSQNGEKST